MSVAEGGRGTGGGRASSLLWRALGRRRGIFRDALIATFAVNTLALAGAFFALQVYDRVIPHAGFSTLYVLAGGVAMAILLELLLKQLRGVLLDREATRVDIELASWFFRRAMGIRMEARPPSLGTFASQIKGLEYLRGVMSSATIFVLADMPFALFFIFVIWLIAGPLAFLPMVMLPLTLVAGLLFQRRINRATAASQGHGNKKAGMLVEAIDGIESLKATGGEEKMQGEWQTLLETAGVDDDRIKHATATAANLTAALQQFGYVALISFGAFLVVDGRLTMGGLIACSIISSRALAPIGRLPGVMTQWAHCRAALRNLDSLIAQPNELDEAERTLEPEVIEGGLQLEAVRFFYHEKDRPALEAPRLQIRAGERVGVIGPVGSGKSTLLKVVSGLYRPKEGRVYLDGLEMGLIRPESLRRWVAYVPQEIRLLRGSLRENLVRGLDDPGDAALLAAARETGLIELINSHPLGLALPISEGGRGISGGQKQLIGLTRLLLIKPRVLLLDEPTASMDAATEAKIVALLGRIAADGVTLVVATHKTALLPLLDRVMVFGNGKLLLDGPREPVLQKLAGKAAPAAITAGNKAASASGNEDGK